MPHHYDAFRALCDLARKRLVSHH